jgi:hypothetical protein
MKLLKLFVKALKVKSYKYLHGLTQRKAQRHQH